MTLELNLHSRLCTRNISRPRFLEGTKASHWVSNFSEHFASDGGGFSAAAPEPVDRRAAALKAQLDALLLCVAGQPHRLATPQEALDVQRLVETLLRGKP